MAGEAKPGAFWPGDKRGKDVKKRAQSWLTLLCTIRPVKTGGPVNTGGLFLVLARDG
jgi:hypothetical protein